MIEQLKRRLAESKEIHEPLRSLKANALNASEKFVLANKSNENGAKVDMATCVNGNVHCEDTHCADFFTQPFVSVKIIPEPVDKWRNLNGNNLLDLMYTDPVRWSFAFQSYVSLSLSLWVFFRCFDSRIYLLVLDMFSSHCSRVIWK